MIIAANWKMCLSPQQAIALAKQFSKLEHNNSTIIVCPSTSALMAVSKELSSTSLDIGAQNCSAQKYGAHTGEESAQTFAALGCKWCIVGHSERRLFRGETNQEIADKTAALIEHNISPIICIGETLQQFKNQQTEATLLKQLEPIIPFISDRKLPICIAYEPVWAIGSGKIPTNEYLSKTFTWLEKQLESKTKNNHLHLLYGGSVKSSNAFDLLSIKTISGFLIGSASLDFQEFEKIVHCTSRQ